MGCDNEKHECKACFPGYYESRSTSGILICKKCKQNDCKECKTAGSQSQTTCNTCFDGFYLENNECSKCELPCSLCSSKEVCTKMWQWNLSNNCDSSCKACFGAQQFHCSSCHDGFYLNESNYCIDCDSSCATCSGTATTSCRSSFYLFKNQCYASCSVLGEGFVNNDENSTCVCGNGFVLNVSVCDPIPTGCDGHRCSVEDKLRKAPSMPITRSLFPK
ncbi:hypothetical protein M9Y10_024357 [Tritrichomonas musculus]|uniref:EGF-like domain-containing protein n=1 Tax=Tritrichomonas musculus TaxID=1915356 RepID=A0ABR2HCR1_9EUKA